MPPPQRKRARTEPADAKKPADIVEPLKVTEAEKLAAGEARDLAPRRNSASVASASKKDCVGTKDGYSHWLMKSEPESRLEKGVDMKFGIEDLKAQPNQTGCWDGVRNYQIVKEAYVDHTQFDKKDAHYDPTSQKENPKWSMVDVQFVRMTKRFIPLAELKKYYQEQAATGGPLKSMALFTRSRLSVQPLTKEEFEFILSLEDKAS